jgi:16S rRNA (guanine527-N7)-methyltransferase
MSNEPAPSTEPAKPVYTALNSTQIDELQVKWNTALPEEEACFNDIMHFFELMLATNQKVNLFSRKLTPELVFQDQFIDCALGLPFFENSAKILDFGCGGGLPGAILAICRPLKELVLVDKSEKKMHYLDKLCQDARLDNVTLSTESNKNIYADVDTLTSRAVAPAEKIIRLTSPHFADKSHKILLYKARRENIDEELKSLPKGYIATIHPVAFPDNARERHMVEVLHS